MDTIFSQLDKLKSSKKDKPKVSRKIGRTKGEKRPTIIEDIVGPEGRSKSIQVTNPTSFLFNQPSSGGSYSRRVESFVASSTNLVDSAGKQTTETQSFRKLRAASVTVPPLNQYPNSRVNDLGTSNEIPLAIIRDEDESETGHPETPTQENLQSFSPAK